jgi:ferrous iron transport protein A
MTLNEMNPGQECRIVKVNVGDATGQRLMDMGFVPGTLIRIVRNAPLVDPVDLFIRGYHVSVRHSEAVFVEVTPL